MARYFVCVGDGPVVGPVRLDQLVRGLATKRVPTEALACLEGGQEWLPVDQIVNDVMTSDEKTLFAAPTVVEPGSGAPKPPPSTATRKGTFDVVQCSGCGTDTPVGKPGTPSKCIQCGACVGRTANAQGGSVRSSTASVKAPALFDNRLVIAATVVLVGFGIVAWVTSARRATTTPPASTPVPPSVTPTVDQKQAAASASAEAHAAAQALWSAAQTVKLRRWEGWDGRCEDRGLPPTGWKLVGPNGDLLAAHAGCRKISPFDFEWCCPENLPAVIGGIPKP